ncbi:MAG: hypothetical protein GY862_16705 [Gammaproteobacteria bacterium]|nr:hypothetical protein [Gammaproteobacteria bacterium]
MLKNMIQSVDAFDDFLARLRTRDIRLRVENGKLKYDAPKGAMTDDLLNCLKQHKVEVIRKLEAQPFQDQESIEELVPVAGDRKLPLSFFQDGFWLNQQKNPDSCLYNIPKLFRIQGKLNLDLLQASLAEIARRHEILRSVFREENGVPIQTVQQNTTVAFAVFDHPELTEAQQARVIEQLTHGCTRQPFQLDLKPAWRASVIRFSAEEFVLLLCYHHIIVDVWSLNVKLYELGSIYTSLAAQQPVSLPELPVQYGDFAYWERYKLIPKAEQACLSYWKNWFAGGIPAAITLPFQKTAEQLSVHAGIVRYRIPESVVQSIAALNKSTNTTLFMGVLAGLAALFQHYSGQDDIILSVPFMSPSHWKQEALIGPTGRILVIRLDLRGNLGFHDLLLQARNTVLAAFDGQHLPFWEAMKRLNIRQDRPGPLFHALLTYTPGASVGRLHLPDLKVESILPKEVTMLINLALIIWEETTPQGTTCFEGWWQYKKDLFEEQSVVKIIHDFQKLLQVACHSPYRPVRSLL